MVGGDVAKKKKCGGGGHVDWVQSIMIRSYEWSVPAVVYACCVQSMFQD